MSVFVVFLSGELFRDLGKFCSCKLGSHEVLGSEEKNIRLN